MRHPLCKAPKGFATLLLLALGLPGCGDTREAANDAPENPRPVQVATAEAVSQPPYVTAAGIIRPYRRARMGTRQTGTVEAVLVRAGERVTAGQEILRVDSRDLEASRAAALAQRDAAQETRDQAIRNRDRFRRLYKQELVAEVRLEEAQLEAERAESALGRAEAELTATEVNMDYARLRAPFSGVVSEILAEQGSFVAPGMPLVVFEDRERLEAEAGIDQASAARLAEGDRLAVAVQGIDQPLEGRLQAVLPALAGGGTGLRLRVLIDDPPAGLVPGMVAELRVPTTRDAPRLVRVPAGALLRRGQLSGVFVLEAGDEAPWRVRLRWLALDQTDRDDDWVYVKRGLEAGERVVLGSATSELVDGQAVELQD